MSVYRVQGVKRFGPGCCQVLVTANSPKEACIKFESDYGGFRFDELIEMDNPNACAMRWQDIYGSFATLNPQSTTRSEKPRTDAERFTVTKVKL